jgi:hypothetical protein
MTIDPVRLAPSMTTVELLLKELMESGLTDVIDG